MQYVYHKAPEKMSGKWLVPLNRLKDEELLNLYKKKYYNHPERSKLLERTIPKLNCLWNDVVHFLPIHPYFVYKALNDTGVNVTSKLQFYKIPMRNLDKNQNALYLYEKETYRGPVSPIEEDQIQAVTSATYKELTTLPSETKDYFDQKHNRGEPMGMFHYIPHILSLGEVDISNAEIIKWKTPPK